MATKHPRAADRPLTPCEQRFVEEYLTDANGVRAYRAAYPDAKYPTAAVQSHRLLRKPNIRTELKARRADHARRYRVRADAVLREFARIAFSDVADLFDGVGTLRPVRDIPLDTRRAITQVKVGRERVTTRTVTVRDGDATVTTTTTVRTQVLDYKLADKIAALGRLSTFLGLEQSIPPLDRVLAVLPADMADTIRAELEAVA
jgi:phage terminase small subunit